MNHLEVFYLGRIVGQLTYDALNSRTFRKFFFLRWMAPETLVKPPKFSKKSDVWAYGVLLYEVSSNVLVPTSC